MKNPKIYTNNHIMIKFCAQLKKTVTETIEMLDVAHTESAMSQANVYWWYKLKSGRKREDEIDEWS